MVLANGSAGRDRAGAGVPFLERHPDEKLFRFCKCSRLSLDRAGVVLPRRMRGFHIFCHLWDLDASVRRAGYLRAHPDRTVERSRLC